MSSTAATTTRKAAARKAPTKPAPKSAPAKAAAPEEQPAPKPAAKKIDATPEPKTLVEALANRQAGLVKVRGNGTRRSLPYLAVGTPGRIEAEAVAKKHAEGATVEALAQELSVSSATARRFLTNLSLAQAVEAGTHDAAWTPGTKEVVVQTVFMKK